MWLGAPDPCESYSLMAEEDPERQEHLQMLAAVESVFKNEKVTARQVIEQAVLEANASLRDVLMSFAQDRGGTLSGKKLGHWLRARDGRIVNGKMFRRAGQTRDHVALWEVVDGG
jgi:hypothetical protein